MTLNGVMAVILRYFSEFGYLPGILRKSSRSLSHLLMSSCFPSYHPDNHHCSDDVYLRGGVVLERQDAVHEPKKLLLHHLLNQH